jgi:hypothetical protein
MTYAMVCPKCHKPSKLDDLPIVGAVYECFYCNKEIKIVRSELCKEHGVHIYAEDFTGWNIKK